MSQLKSVELLCEYAWGRTYDFNDIILYLSNLQQLESLTTSTGVSFPSALIQESSYKFRSLRRLCIHYSRMMPIWTRVLPFLKALEHLRISVASRDEATHEDWNALVDAMSECHQLKTLSLHQFDGLSIGQPAFKKLTSTCRMLQSLTMYIQLPIQGHQIPQPNSDFQRVRYIELDTWNLSNLVHLFVQTREPPDAVTLANLALASPKLEVLRWIGGTFDPKELDHMPDDVQYRELTSLAFTTLRFGRFDGVDILENFPFVEDQLKRIWKARMPRLRNLTIHNWTTLNAGEHVPLHAPDNFSDLTRSWYLPGLGRISEY